MIQPRRRVGQKPSPSPRAPVQDTPSPPSGTASAANKATGRLLIIDDEKMMIRFLKATLEEAGYSDIHATNDPRDAVPLFLELEPDLVLLDFNMPGLDGLQVIGALAEAERRRAPDSYLPVVIMTANRDPEIRRRALAAGAQDFLMKPLDPLDVTSRVRNLVRVRRLHRQDRDQTRILKETVEKRTARLTESISLLKQAESKLSGALEKSRAESDAKSAMLATATHEMRTPLAAIVGSAEILNGEILGPLGHDDYREQAAQIHQTGLYLLDLVNRTLDMSKTAAGADDLDIGAADLPEVLGAAFSMVEVLARKANVEVKLDIMPNFPAIRTDGQKLTEVAVNLLSNAIKFTPPRGSVTLKAWADNDGAFILVFRDTGIGIAAEDIATVLQPFGQVKEAQKAGGKGTGLGLPHTQRVVESLGGELAIESLPGIGTTVTLRFPPSLVDAAPDPAPPDQSPDRPQIASSSFS